MTPRTRRARRAPRIGLAIAIGLALPASGARAVDVDGTLAALRSLRASYARSPEGLPVAFEHTLTAWQTTPRWLVLSGGRTPGEADPYVLTHPSFRFVWADGTTLLVDAGLSAAAAGAFGSRTEWLGAEPMVCGRDPFAAWDATRVGAAVFTHLHVDHVDGLASLCRAGAPVPVRLSPEQRASKARFEVGGRDRLDELASAGCVRDEPWEERGPGLGAAGLAGFAGVHRVAVPGHTPGSQLLVGFLASPPEGPPRAVVVAGDVVNHRAGVRHDRPKPWWYRRLLVREDDDLQGRNRALLARLEQEGFEVWVNHHVAVTPGEAEAPCE